MGRFTLRDEGKTVAIGKVTKLVETQTDVADGVGNMTLGGTSAA